jgi:L-malate glycosyltransferase
LKMLFVAPKYTGSTGGHASTVAEKLRGCGFDVKLMRVPHIPIKKLKNPSFAAIGTMKALLGKEDYDIVHAWNVPSAFIMKVVRAKKKVLSLHGVYSEQISMLHSSAATVMVGAAEPKVLRWADSLVTDSKAVQQTYKEKLGFKFTYLPIPLDTAKFADVPAVEKVPDQIVYIGRDSYEKGIDILQSIEGRIKGKVVYCTDLPWKEAMTLLKKSAVIVLPSRVESLPQVIKEAFYLKVPVIATNVGGVPELVTHDVNGILVKPGDSNALADSINDLLFIKEKQSRLAEAAYDHLMKNWTWDVLLPKYVKFYEDLLEE